MISKTHLDFFNVSSNKQQHCHLNIICFENASYSSDKRKEIYKHQKDHGVCPKVRDSRKLPVRKHDNDIVDGRNPATLVHALSQYNPTFYSESVLSIVTNRRRISSIHRIERSFGGSLCWIKAIRSGRAIVQYAGTPVWMSTEIANGMPIHQRYFLLSTLFPLVKKHDYGLNPPFSMGRSTISAIFNRYGPNQRVSITP